MIRNRSISLLAFFGATIIGFSGCTFETQSDGAPADYRIVGYVFAPGTTKLPAIEASQLTHINYAFAQIVDGRIAHIYETDSTNLASVVALRKRNPDLKILISVGGWGRSGGFSDAALTPESRRAFAASAAEFLTKYDLDGVDIDWEYPGQAGAGNTYRPEDKTNFTLFLSAIRRALDEREEADGRPYLLTIATQAAPVWFEHTEMDKVARIVDFVNVMTYDFSGGWTDTTWHHANLYKSHAPGASRIGVDLAVQLHIDAGIPGDKTVVGVPFYGRGWVGVESESRNGLFEPASDQPTEYSYHDLASNYVDTNGFVRYWDEESEAPYLWNAGSGTFVTYDDPESLRHKTDFIRGEGLGGVMFWQYGADTTGTLLRTLHEQLLGGRYLRH